MSTVSFQIEVDRLQLSLSASNRRNAWLRQRLVCATKAKSTAVQRAKELQKELLSLKQALSTEGQDLEELVEEVCNQVESPYTGPKQETLRPLQRTASSDTGPTPSCSCACEESSSEKAHDRPRLRLLAVAKQLQGARQEMQELSAEQRHESMKWAVPLHKWDSSIMTLGATLQVGYCKFWKCTSADFSGCTLREGPLNVILEEAKKLAPLCHPAILHPFAVLKPEPGTEAALKGNAYLVLPELQQSVEKMLATQAPEKLPVRDVVVNLCRLASGLGLMHGKGMVHNDLHVGNILVGQDGWVISNFWNSQPRHKPNRDLNELRHMMLGRGLEAPEAAKAFLEDGKYTPNWRHDMWAFGHLLVQLLGGMGDLTQMDLVCKGGSTLQYAADLLSAPPGHTYADKVWLPYPILRPEENLVLEPIIRGCFADADQHWTAFQVAKTLYAFMQSQSWV